MSTKFTTGEVVEILSGKFRGSTGEVLAVRQDKNGIERVQVGVGGGIFSYMLNSVKSAGATTVESSETVAPTTPTTEAVESSNDEGFSFGEGF